MIKRKIHVIHPRAVSNKVILFQYFLISLITMNIFTYELLYLYTKILILKILIRKRNPTRVLIPKMG